jgi:hypothetical protein
METLVALRLAKEGFGTPEQILAMPADVVVDAVEYALFLSDYQDAVIAHERETNK